jgi:hypothetical protein
LGAHEEVSGLIRNYWVVDIGSQILPYQTLHVSYKSTISWCRMTDILRAHPKFHNHPWYDHILIDAGQGKHFFAQLLYIFGTFVKGKTHHFALVLPYNLPIPCAEQPPINQHFQFTQV